MKFILSQDLSLAEVLGMTYPEAILRLQFKKYTDYIPPRK